MPEKLQLHQLPAAFPHIRLVALDLDDTTLNDQSRLSGRTRAALERAAAGGAAIVVATGRPYAAVAPEVLALPGVRYAVTSNGAAVYDAHSGQRIHAHLLPAECVAPLLELLPPDALGLDTSVNGIAYAEEKLWKTPAQYCVADKLLDYFSRTRRPHADLRGFLLENANRLESLAIWCRSPEIMYRLRETITHRFPDLYHASASCGLLDVAHPLAGKANGLHFLAQQLQIPQAQIAAFGNGNNDTDMLAWAGLGVAVANAASDCLAAADHVTASNEDDGVAMVLEALF